MDNFADKLQKRIDQLGNPTCIGLDPMLSYLPPSLLKEYDCAQEEGIYQALSHFCCDLLVAVADLVPAVKPQMAYFEQYGLGGMRALRAIIAKARSLNMLVILDGKRNDIGSTAAAYSRAYLSADDRPDDAGETTRKLDSGVRLPNEISAKQSSAKDTVLNDHAIESFLTADALTVNAYLGLDGIQPFLEQCRANGKGIFALCRTSNPSAGDLQDLELADGRLVYEAMADLIATWGQDLIGETGISSVGAVVGATWPQQARSLRKRMPHNFFLIPGFGAQGASARDAIAGFNHDGGAAIVNASRSLMLAWKKQGKDHEAYAEACRLEAISMRDALRSALGR